MFIEDLSTEAYFAKGEKVRAIGWLESGHPFTRGSVPPDFLATLKVHLAAAHQVVLFRGLHDCSLCSGRNRARGYRNLLIPTPDLLYVAPELLLHYIKDHNYQPPAEFEHAVCSCPEQGSPAFLQLLTQFEGCWQNKSS